MALLSNWRIKIAASLFWIGNMLNIVVQAKSPGYYPKNSLVLANIQAIEAPLPLYDILWAALLLTMSLLAICFLAVRNTYGPLFAMLFSLALTMVYTLATPTDIGGVHYALTQYTICTLLLTVLFVIAFYVAKIFKLGIQPIKP